MTIFTQTENKAILIAAAVTVLFVLILGMKEGGGESGWGGGEALQRSGNVSPEKPRMKMVSTPSKRIPQGSPRS